MLLQNIPLHHIRSWIDIKTTHNVYKLKQTHRLNECEYIVGDKGHSRDIILGDMKMYWKVSNLINKAKFLGHSWYFFERIFS